MIVVITPCGDLRCLYSEAIDLASLGSLTIRRASHVDPDELGQWWADLTPSGAPKLGPFPARSAALDAERRWLEQHYLNAPRETRPLNP